MNKVERKYGKLPVLQGTCCYFKRHTFGNKEQIDTLDKKRNVPIKNTMSKQDEQKDVLNQ